MRERLGGPPEALRRVLRRLLPGQRGAEIVEELDGEYAARRARGGHAGAAARLAGVAARVWYLAQLVRPSTWQLARALRRTWAADRAMSGGAARDPAGHGWPRGLSLEVKLAFRTLAKSPGLTVVGVLGIALGTAIGVGFFVVLSSIVYPRLPLAEGERIVALENWNVEINREERRTLHDFLAWREELRTVTEVAAASIGSRQLVTGDAPPRDVRAAAMTAAGFEVPRVPPLLGRLPDEADERVGAPAVVVLGHELWEAHFGGDRGVIGRQVLLGDASHAVIGIMPPGFSFPRNEELWTALQPDGARHARGGGPELFVFGRLAPGATMVQAEAEVAALGVRTAQEFAGTNAWLRPRVLPYIVALDDVQGITPWTLAQVQFMITLVLVAIAVNLSVLVYARTALRQGEIALRTALGASRRRIVLQLFVEALVLSLLGAGLGLAIARLALQQVQHLVQRLNMVGFWVDYGIQPRAVALAVGLALLAAAIMGVLPGLRSTGRQLEAHMRRIGSGGTVALGRMWTSMIVLQVAVAVAVLPAALHLGINEMRWAGVRATYPAHEVVSAEIAQALPLRAGVSAAQHQDESRARFADRLPSLQRRVQAEPAVSAVTFEGRLPGRGELLEVEGVPRPLNDIAHRARATGVAYNYFDALGVPVLAGRSFRHAETGESGSVMVSEAFARRVIGDAPAVGRRARFIEPAAPGEAPDAARPGPWLEIVGVVGNLQASIVDAAWAPPAVFYPVTAGELRAATLLVRVRNGSVGGVASRLRHIAAEIDPELRFGAVGNHASMIHSPVFTTIVAALAGVLLSVMLLSAAGIHALTSLAVTRRRKEIGIRRAIGSRAGRLLTSIFSRAAWQLGLGALAGSAAGGALLVVVGRSGREIAGYVGGVVVLMLVAGLLASIGPALRGLGIQPIEALKEE